MRAAVANMLEYFVPSPPPLAEGATVPRERERWLAGLSPTLARRWGVLAALTWSLLPFVIDVPEAALLVGTLATLASLLATAFVCLVGRAR